MLNFSVLHLLKGVCSDFNIAFPQSFGDSQKTDDDNDGVADAEISCLSMTELADLHV